MTGPVSMWHSARSMSDSGFASDVRKSASRKSAQVTSRNGVATRLRVLPKNSRVSCMHGRTISIVPKSATGQCVWLWDGLWRQQQGWVSLSAPFATQQLHVCSLV